jgi:hypothetical protein
MGLCFKSNYWLRILKELYSENSEILRLTEESFELKNILESITLKVSPLSQKKRMQSSRKE